ncbi:hypothetical protein [Rhizobium sp. AU243]|uniref:hypothetical protein n=1 Tax=Rhizobium sp. AU243 TaxID=2303425 RepID=UPI0010CC525F|nr:hypothetical protein [Rhizobium sp. AU243]TKV76722.1 hypothetical protein D0C28_14205 [Rhizobium sp. AU243]
MKESRFEIIDRLRSLDADQLLEQALKPSVSKGISESMETVDAKIAAAEARTDTKFAELLGELRLINQRMEHVERSTSGMRSTVIGTGIGVVAVVIAIMAYGAQWFGLGMDAQQVAERAVQGAAQQVQPQIDALASSSKDLDGKLNLIIRALGEPKMLGNGGDIPAPYKEPSK